MLGPKYTNTQIQEIFQEGNLIARAFNLTSKRKESHLYDLQGFENELKFLNTKKEGINNQSERHGQRNRSATLLVPEVEMGLFHDIGMLYDGNKSTVRAYMFYDSTTLSGLNHDNNYNIN